MASNTDAAQVEPPISGPSSRCMRSIWPMVKLTSRGRSIALCRLTAYKAIHTGRDVPLHSYAIWGRREATQRANDCALSPLRRPASSPSIPICSSRSGHSIAYPLPSNCQWCRSAGDPCTRRGYHARGTTRLRPSARSTVNLSYVTVTCTTTGSVSSTKVVMPRLKESCLMLPNKSRNPAELVCAQAAIGHERHRFQPELGHGPLPLHVDVRRFATVGTEENETVRFLTKESRYRATFLARIFLHSKKRFYAEQREVATKAERSRCAAPTAGARQLGSNKARSDQARFLSAPVSNRACGRVGHQRVARVGTFPMAPLQTARESFDLKQLSSDLCRNRALPWPFTV